MLLIPINFFKKFNVLWSNLRVSHTDSFGLTFWIFPLLQSAVACFCKRESVQVPPTSLVISCVFGAAPETLRYICPRLYTLDSPFIPFMLLFLYFF
uniref:Uncharacterized protein LOC104246177 isoform X3 n=1 Tax=Nicotiana sylvestris TaxID=4096 RepID=A0A1U7YN20_NICSY|nr:PREDICTED: uncharacterized protein LOC104246177 isoform X3 [Nicotiana sylvestris]